MRPRLLVTVLLLSPAMGGCAWRSVADPARAGLERPAPLAAEAWPVRSVEALVSGDAAGPMVTRARDDSAGVVEQPELIFGPGTIELIQEATTEQPLSFAVATLAPAEEMVTVEVVAGGQRYEMRIPSGETVFERVSTSCVLFPALDGPSRGLVVHLTSLMTSSPYEGAVMHELRERGWTVLEVSHPTLMWETRLYGLAPGDDAARTGRSFAQEADGVLAEWAYAVEAARAYLAAAHPEVPQRPCVLLGVSLGSVVLPAVAARDAEAIDAAVLVAGGANLSDILHHVTVTDGNTTIGLHLMYVGQPTREELATFRESYLQSSMLDPYRTAAYLNGVPVLQMHALFDDIVPARTGDLLYERLGRPERWSYPFGHFGMIWWMPREADRIADWIDAAVEGGRTMSTQPARLPSAAR